MTDASATQQQQIQDAPAEDDSEADIEYVDDEIIEALDQDDDYAAESDDFKTMKESELDANEQMMFGEGQVLEEVEIQKDYVC